MINDIILFVVSKRDKVVVIDGTSTLLKWIQLISLTSY